ncbi:hypothetical protein CEXT_104291 [Caerostris extrusa]|uniref:Uncharacterized protein n=1 Tax=Caerostris extrusa TaxID=172846 RepID=A0AAV4MNC0_CAEEX|nr:hypothetical protein CEXT_104291 [Caerostris extrusa]
MLTFDKALGDDLGRPAMWIFSFSDFRFRHHWRLNIASVQPYQYKGINNNNSQPSSSPYTTSTEIKLTLAKIPLSGAISFWHAFETTDDDIDRSS